MSKSTGFDQIIRSMRLGKLCAERSITAAEGLERAAEARQRHAHAAISPSSRRKVLKGLAGVTAGALGFSQVSVAARSRPDVSIGIVGAGLAGLACADELATAGIVATLYEGRERIGGRQWSMGGNFAGPVMFPGQVVERGGELIDTTHTTIKAYAKRFKLKLEDVTRQWLPGEVSYFFGGRHVSEEEVVAEFRDLADRVRPDLARLSNYVDYQSHTPFDVAMDNTNLREYLERVGAGPVAMAALDVSYHIEYGAEIEQQNVLNWLFFMHIDKRSRFQPFGVFSDERYHIIGGNEQIARGIANSLPGPIELGLRLLRVSKRSDGRVQLTFDDNGHALTVTHDAVVFAIPYSTLRDVELPADLPASNRFAIDNLFYGANTKMHVGFNRRFWGDFGSEGASYSDLPNHQTTWEPNPSGASPGNAVLLDYSGGPRAANLNPSNVDLEVSRWLADVEKIWGGAIAAAKKTAPAKFLAHMQHWPSDPFSKGSYTCNRPGYFTQLEGRVGTPAGNLFFCGEHTDSFYEWQGYMEGALNSGIRAAGELLAEL
jgi:monoamine oxidase